MITLTVIVNMSKATGNSHQGIFMENGSGGVMTDLVFNGVRDMNDTYNDVKHLLAHSTDRI